MNIYEHPQRITSILDHDYSMLVMVRGSILGDVPRDEEWLADKAWHPLAPKSDAPGSGNRR